MLSAVGASVKVSDHQLKMVRRNKYLAQTLDLPFYALIILIVQRNIFKR
jgi:hypothetical protein